MTVHNNIILFRLYKFIVNSDEIKTLSLEKRNDFKTTFLLEVDKSKLTNHIYCFFPNILKR